MPKNEKDLLRVLRALDHPIRRKIITLAGEKGRLGYKELSEALQVPPGTLYHHIRALGPLITKDTDGKYTLTQLGEKVYEFLKSGDVQVLKGLPPPRDRSPFVQVIEKRFFVPLNRFLYYILSAPTVHVIDAILIIVLGCLVYHWGGMCPLILSIVFEYKYSSILETVALFLLNVLFIFVICNALCKLVFKARGGNLSLLIGVVYSQLPLIIFSSLVYIVKLQGLSSIAVNWNIIGILLFAFQIIALMILIEAISISKHVPRDKALIIALIILYMNLIHIMVIYPSTLISK
ncbi:MAG: hypothetical protein ACTSXX_05470 [Candidatus Baldrarchaeia archaeon]